MKALLFCFALTACASSAPAPVAPEHEKPAVVAASAEDTAHANLVRAQSAVGAPLAFRGEGKCYECTFSFTRSCEGGPSGADSTPCCWPPREETTMNAACVEQFGVKPIATHY